MSREPQCERHPDWAFAATTWCSWDHAWLTRTQRTHPMCSHKTHARTHGPFTVSAAPILVRKEVPILNALATFSPANAARKHIPRVMIQPRLLDTSPYQRRRTAMLSHRSRPESPPQSEQHNCKNGTRSHKLRVVHITRIFRRCRNVRVYMGTPRTSKVITRSSIASCRGRSRPALGCPFNDAILAYLMYPNLRIAHIVSVSRP
jgi:hypothetical protein